MKRNRLFLSRDPNESGVPNDRNFIIGTKSDCHKVNPAGIRYEVKQETKNTAILHIILLWRGMIRSVIATYFRRGEVKRESFTHTMAGYNDTVEALFTPDEIGRLKAQLDSCYEELEKMLG